MIPVRKDETRDVVLAGDADADVKTIFTVRPMTRREEVRLDFQSVLWLRPKTYQLQEVATGKDDARRLEAFIETRAAVMAACVVKITNAGEEGRKLTDRAEVVKFLDGMDAIPYEQLHDEIKRLSQVTDAEGKASSSSSSSAEPGPSRKAKGSRTRSTADGVAASA